MYEGDFFLQGLPTLNFNHPVDTPRFLQLGENAGYPRGLLRMKGGYGLVLHHSGVIDIADTRRLGDRDILRDISVLHLTRGLDVRCESWTDGRSLWIDRLAVPPPPGKLGFNLVGNEGVFRSQWGRKYRKYLRTRTKLFEFGTRTRCTPRFP